MFRDAGTADSDNSSDGGDSEDDDNSHIEKEFGDDGEDDIDDVMTLVEGEIADEIMDEQSMLDNIGQDMAAGFEFTDEYNEDADAAELDFELQMMEEYRLQMEMNEMQHILDCELDELDKTFERQNEMFELTGGYGNYDENSSRRCERGTKSCGLKYGNDYETTKNTHTLADLVDQLASGNKAILHDIEELNVFGRILAIGEDDVIYTQGDMGYLTEQHDLFVEENNHEDNYFNVDAELEDDEMKLVIELNDQLDNLKLNQIDGGLGDDGLLDVSDGGGNDRLNDGDEHEYEDKTSGGGDGGFDSERGEILGITGGHDENVCIGYAVEQELEKNDNCEGNNQNVNQEFGAIDQEYADFEEIEEDANRVFDIQKSVNEFGENSDDYDEELDNENYLNDYLEYRRGMLDGDSDIGGGNGIGDFDDYGMEAEHNDDCCESDYAAGIYD